jgi:hypothetical protein
MQVFRRLLLAFRAFYSIMRQGSLRLESIETPKENNHGESDEIEGASDADIGVAARVIHRGCRQVLDNYFDLVPAYPGIEGNMVTVESGFDPNIVELIGLTGEPPFSGTLNHQGWRIREIRMPTLTAGFSASLIQRAEIER